MKNPERSKLGREVALVIPSYKSSKTLEQVVNDGLKYADKVFVIDDFCPEASGKLVEKISRVEIIFRTENGGVGAATLDGFSAAAEQGFTYIIKVDSDGQMDASLIPRFVSELATRADYVKGNRFSSIAHLRQMPKVRIFGNAVLSLFAKISTGYWSCNDPTNGFIGIRASLFQSLDRRKVSKRFFFESDMLLSVYLEEAVVSEVSHPARYGDEKSNLAISKVVFEFPVKHLRNFMRRLIMTYFVKSWSPGTFLISFGVGFGFLAMFLGVSELMRAASQGTPLSSARLILTAILGLTSVQTLLSFLSYDVQTEPKAR